MGTGMGLTAMIGKLNRDGTVKGIYFQYADIQYTGMILEEFFQEDNDVDRLLKNGSLVNIRKCPEDSVADREIPLVRRDGVEVVITGLAPGGVHTYPNLGCFLTQSTYDVVRTFLHRNGAWWVTSNDLNLLIPLSKMKELLDMYEGHWF